MLNFWICATDVSSKYVGELWELTVKSSNGWYGLASTEEEEDERERV